MMWSRSLTGKRYLLLASATAALSLTGFLVVELLDFTPLETAESLSGGGVQAGVLGFGLLLADVVLPVPSSLVMIGMGRICGFLPALLLCWAGSTGSTMLGFWLGRRGTRTARTPQRVEDLLGRWGVVAVGLTRPVPILAETVAVAAGTSRLLPARHAMAAAAVGSLPAAIVYSAAGAYAGGAASDYLVLPMVLALTAVLWAAGRRWTRKPATARPMAPLLLRPNDRSVLQTRRRRMAAWSLPYHGIRRVKGHAQDVSSSLPCEPASRR